MEQDEEVQEGLQRSNARFIASMNRIMKRYNHPFEDDLLVSMVTLTYDTPNGTKRWEHESRRDVKRLKRKMFKHSRRSQKNTEVSESSDFEDEASTAQPEPSECIAVDTSDSDEESDDIGTVRRKFKDIHLQNLNEDDGQILKKERVQVDLIVRGDDRRIPKWITITTPSPLKSHHLPLQVHELHGSKAAVCRKKLEMPDRPSSSKYLHLQHSDDPISSNTIASPRHRHCPDLGMTPYDRIRGEYQSADEECSWSSTTLADLYPAMVEILTKILTKYSRRKVLKYMFGHFRSKKHRSRRQRLNVTVDKMKGLGPCKPKKAFHSSSSCRSEDNQNGTFGNESREFCNQNGTFGNESREFCNQNGTFGNESREFCNQNGTFGNESREFCNQNGTFGNESREFCCDSSPISNSYDQAPYTDTNEIKMGYSDSSLEQHLVSGKVQEVCKQTAFPDVMDKMEETFLVEDELETTASPKNSEYTEREKLAYKHFSESTFIISTAISDSKPIHLVKESKTRRADFSVGTSELCSSACSSHGNSNNSVLTTNFSPTRSNTGFIYPEKIISERPTFFQHKDSFSLSFMKQSPSKTPNKYKDAFEELYYKVCSEESQESSMWARPLLNSQNLEVKGRSVKSNLSDSGRSTKQCDRDFDRIYEKLSRKFVPEFPGLQAASNFRKYEEIQIPETVNALVNSPVRTYSEISRVKRAGNSQNYLPCSPVKRLKVIPEHFSSRKCRETFHSTKGNLHAAGMDLLSTYCCSNHRGFADHSCHCQVCASHGYTDKTFLGIPGISLQESGTAGVRSGWREPVENCSSLRKCHGRVYRKLSYTDGNDHL